MGGHLAQDAEPQPQLTAKLRRKKAFAHRAYVPCTEGDGGPQPSFKIRGSYLFCREKPSEVAARKAVHRLRVGTGVGSVGSQPQHQPIQRWTKALHDLNLEVKKGAAGRELL